MRRYGKTGGNGARFDTAERGDGGRIWGKKKKGNAVFCVIPSVALFLLALKNPRLGALRDNGVISPIRKSSEGLWVGAAHSRLFVLPHFINQQPEAPRNQFSRLAAHSFVPMWQSEREINQFTTFTLLPNIINHLFVFFLLLSRLLLFLSYCKCVLMPNVTSINPRSGIFLIHVVVTILSIDFFLEEEIISMVKYCSYTVCYSALENQLWNRLPLGISVQYLNESHASA